MVKQNLQKNWLGDQNLQYLDNRQLMQVTNLKYSCIIVMNSADKYTLTNLQSHKEEKEERKDEGAAWGSGGSVMRVYSKLDNF